MLPPSTTTAWARQVELRGVDLPIRIGVPGAVTRQKLVRISAGLELGQSARFPAEQQSMFWRSFLPHGYRPDRLVEGLAPTLGQPEDDLQGFHFSTFDEVARTKAWRQEWPARLSDAGTGQRGGQPAGGRHGRARSAVRRGHAPGLGGGLRYPAANSLLVSGTEVTVLVDPSIEVGRRGGLHADVGLVALTLPHEDHVAGLHVFPEVPVVAHLAESPPSATPKRPSPGSAWRSRRWTSSAGSCPGPSV